MKNLLSFFLVLIAITIAVPVLAGPNIAVLPGAPANYSDHLVYNSTNRSVMFQVNARGDDYIDMKVSAEPGKTFVLTDEGRRQQVAITDDPTAVSIGLGKNPPDRQSFSHILTAEWLPDQCGVEWQGVYWPRGKTLGFWFPTRVRNPKTGHWIGSANWVKSPYCMEVPWYSDYFYEHGRDVWIYAKRGLDGRIYPLGHAKEPLPPNAVDGCTASANYR